MPEVVSTQTLLDEVNAAIRQIVNGAKSIMVNGHQYHYSSIGELREWRKQLRLEVAEESGTDGRGAWSGVFSD